MSNEIEASSSKTKQEDVVIDVVACQESIKKKLEEYTKEPTKEEEPIPTIYRVPERIRWGVNDPYEPLVISIGPYHRGKPSLEAMEKEKWQCLRRVLSRNKWRQLQDYIVEINKLEVRARSCYSEKIEINSEDFVEMMLLDGCFLMQFLRDEKLHIASQIDMQRKYNESHLDMMSPLRRFDMMSHLDTLVRYDMLLLENQIPFFILECIFDLSYTQETPIMELAKKFCTYMLFFSTQNMVKEPETFHLTRFDHLLHVFHGFYTFRPQLIHNFSYNRLEQLKSKLKDLLSPIHGYFRDHFPWRWTWPDTEGTILFHVIPSAVELHDAGVKFRKKRACYSLLDVTFKDGVFEIPPLFVSDVFEREFRNLIAFEQLYPFVGTQFSQYALFMDHIISTSNDVALLHKENILHYEVGSMEDVANLFNRISRRVIVNRGPFPLIYENVKSYCKEKRHQWRASLVRKYFNNPWSVISVLAAAILLILTFIQAYFSGYSIFHSH